MRLRGVAVTSQRESASTQSPQFDSAWKTVADLVDQFARNSHHYLSANYQEAEVRRDFIDKFFAALGWDVYHDTQQDPYRQEVKVEKSNRRAAGRADYAFSLAPLYRRVRFVVEAKRPQQTIITPDNCFQAIRYSWPLQIPVAILTDFKSLHVIDARFRPNIDSATTRVVRSWQCEQFRDKESFAEVYWLLSREAVADNSLDRFSSDVLPEQKVATRQYSLFPNEAREFDEDFLTKLDEWREQLAMVFKLAHSELTGVELTEAVQRTIDRLIFIRFLEDKQIEEQPIISRFGHSGKTHWKDFVAQCRRLDSIYNGIVFKPHPLIDSANFQPAGVAFAEICDELTDEHSPYNFNSIPVEILGRIYERFLGKIVQSTASNKVRIVQKEEVRKAGGVYYTPDYIVSYMVEQALSALASTRSVDQILRLRIIDTSCGSGSFLIGAFQYLMEAILKIYREDRSKAKKGALVLRDEEIHLSMPHKREILLKCIYGVDIDPQAVEVAQLSLYLKLMEDETTHSAHQQQLEMGAALLPSLSSNIVVGNSLLTLDGDLFALGRLRELKSLDFRATFPEVFAGGGFDLVIGNPPYIKEYTNRGAFDHVRDSPYFEGKMDIWYMFACRGMDWLKPSSGILAFIATNNWLTNAGAKKLRTKITDEGKIEQLIDFGNYKVFRDAGIQTMILIARRSGSPRTYSFDYRTLSLPRATQQDALALLEKRPGDGFRYLSAKFNRDRIKTSPLTFSDASKEELLAKIKARQNFVLEGNREIAQGIVPNVDAISAKALEHIPSRRRQLENITAGMGVFVVPEDQFRSLSGDEREYLKPLYSPTDIDRYAIVERSTQRIIYSTRDNTAEAKLPERFLNHLKKFREVMERRRENQTGQIKFFQLHWPRDERFFARGPKILAVRKCEEPTFAYTERDAYVMMAFNVIKTDRIDLKYLTGLLNSRVMRFWLRHRGKMQGHHFQIDKEPLLALPLHAPSPAQQQKVARMVDKLIECREELQEAKTSAEQEQLSRLFKQRDEKLQEEFEAVYQLSKEDKELIAQPVTD